jgi:hypothetical protein
MIVFLKRESSFLKRESDFLGGSKDLATGQSGGDGLFAFGAHLLREPQYGCERDGSLLVSGERPTAAGGTPSMNAGP